MVMRKHPTTKSQKPRERWDWTKTPCYFKLIINVFVASSDMTGPACGRQRKPGWNPRGTEAWALYTWLDCGNFSRSLAATCIRLFTVPFRFQRGPTKQCTPPPWRSRKTSYEILIQNYVSRLMTVASNYYFIPNADSINLVSKFVL